MDTCAVILEAYGRLDIETIAPLITATLGLVSYDAIRLVRDARGIIAENLTPATAERLRQRLDQAGVATRVIPQATVVRIGKPRIVRMVEVGEQSLGVVWGYAGTAEPVDWSSIFLITAGEIKVTETHLQAPRRKPRRNTGMLSSALMTFGLNPIVGIVMTDLAVKAIKNQPGPAARPMPAAVYQQPLLDLFALGRDGSFEHIRMQSRDMYYDRILGSQIQRDFQANFRLLVAAIAAKAVRAQISPETLTLVQPPDRRPADAADPDFGDLNEFTQYNRWLLQMMQVHAGGRG